jgi:alkylation response protein AidB-like acyl-CoA dehydrogenase
MGVLGQKHLFAEGAILQKQPGAVAERVQGIVVQEFDARTGNLNAPEQSREIVHKASQIFNGNGIPVRWAANVCIAYHYRILSAHIRVLQSAWGVNDSGTKELCPGQDAETLPKKPADSTNS